MDKSNGYEAISEIFAKTRGVAFQGIGSSFVRRWAKSLTQGSTILDIGCGTGIPVSKISIEEGMSVYAIDASPTLVGVFRKNFPNVPVACEAAEESAFFNRQFDAIISWGLMFILPVPSQKLLIKKAATALNSGGRFLFTPTRNANTWNDAMTEQLSVSLGADKYKEMIAESGLTLIKEFEDEGENYYFDSVKI